MQTPQAPLPHSTVHSQRYHGLDFLRGIMMLLGLVIHSAVFYITMGQGYRDPSVSPIMDYIIIFISAFRMPAFFILSGFFTALLFYRRGLPQMLHNRQQRILTPFLVFMPFCLLSFGILSIIGAHIAAHGIAGWDINLIENKRYLWDDTLHLWYLYYLIMYLIVSALTLKLLNVVKLELLHSVLKKLRIHLNQSIKHVYGIIFYGSLIGLIGLNDPDGRVIGSGRLIPEFETFFFYASFYLLGWIIYLSSDLLETFRQYCWWYLGFAAVSLVVAIASWLNQGQVGDDQYPLLHTFLACSNGIIATLFSFAFMGLSLRFCKNHNPYFRYLTDASYWVYLIHMSTCFAFVLLFYRWQAPAELKFMVVFLLSTAVCFGSYHFFVRSSAIGALLNGRRYSGGLHEKASLQPQRTTPPNQNP